MKWIPPEFWKPEDFETDPAMSYLEWGTLILVVAGIVAGVGFTVGLFCGWLA